jgi:hypothetical protein
MHGIRSLPNSLLVLVPLTYPERYPIRVSAGTPAIMSKVLHGSPQLSRQMPETWLKLGHGLICQFISFYYPLALASTVILGS